MDIVSTQVIASWVRDIAFGILLIVVPIVVMIRREIGDLRVALQRNRERSREAREEAAATERKVGAERRMLDAYKRYRDLRELRDMHEDVADMSGRSLEPLDDAVLRAASACAVAYDAWLAEQPESVPEGAPLTSEEGK